MELNQEMELGTAPEQETIVQAETPIETPVEETVTEAVTEEAPAEIPAETAEEVKEEAVEEVVEEGVEGAEEAPAIIFDANDEDLLTKVDEVFDKYELPPDIVAGIEALKLKAESQPSPIEAYSVYGDTEAIESLLKRQSYINTARKEGEGYRPNTDEFVKAIPDDDTKDWLFYDLSQQPSAKYQGATKFEESIIELFGKNGEPPAETMGRYTRLVEHLQNNTFPDSDRPSFIPDTVAEAFFKLSKDSRNELSLLDPSDEYDKGKIEAKLNELELIQRGLDGEKAIAQSRAQAENQKVQQFTEAVQTTQATFFNAFRDEVAKDLAKNVPFSTDPKLNSFLATQQLALLTEALDPSGTQARQALAEAGVNFDYNRAQSLISDVERSAVELVKAKANPHDVPSLNRATKEFERVGRALQVFAKDIIDQEARLVSTGTAQAVKEQAEKIKVAPKARLAPKGSPTSTTNKTKVPEYGSPEWRNYVVDREWEAAQRYRAA